MNGKGRKIILTIDYELSIFPSEKKKKIYGSKLFAGKLGVL